MPLSREKFSAAICIILISIFPAMGDAIYALGGTSSIAQSGGGQIEGSWSQAYSRNSVPGQSDLLAGIWSEVSVPPGQKGSASVEWSVPRSSSATRTESSTAQNYRLTVSAYGNVTASAAKSSESGTAWACGYIMSDACMSPEGSSGYAEISSEVFLTGSGTASASARGAASYSTSVGLPGRQMDFKTSGTIEGETRISALNDRGIISSEQGYLRPAFARLCVDSSVGSGSVSSSARDSIHLAACRNTTGGERGACEVNASASGSKMGDSTITGKVQDRPATSAHVASLIDMRASAVAYYEIDEASVELDLRPEAYFDGPHGASDTGINAHNSLDLHTSARRGRGLDADESVPDYPASMDAEAARATADIAGAMWEASASRDAGRHTWKASLSGDTGPGGRSPNATEETGFATGAVALREDGAIRSEIEADQDAGVYCGDAYTSSYVGLRLTGPAYMDEGSDAHTGADASADIGADLVCDASGARFALNSEKMSASNGNNEIGDVLGTGIAGPSAFLWITEDCEQIINGRYAEDASGDTSIYKVIFSPGGSGRAPGPDVNEDDSFIRVLSLVYSTNQPGYA